MALSDLITELERRCPGCSFSVTAEPPKVHIVEYSRGFTVDLAKESITAEEWFEFELARRSADQIPPLQPDGRYCVNCSRCGKVVIGYGNYRDQMNQPNSRWYCPCCSGPAAFDDETYENYPEE